MSGVHSASGNVKKARLASSRRALPHVDPDPLCHPRRRRYRAVAVRAAGAARAARLRRRRRAAATARGRARADGHVHRHDRRDRQGRRRRRARRGSVARHRGGRAARLRRRDARAGDGGTPGGAALAAGRFGPSSTGRRLPLGPARRRRARVRLHALRRPDPRGRDLGQRRQRANDRVAIAYSAGSAVVLLALDARRQTRCSTACAAPVAARRCSARSA